MTSTGNGTLLTIALSAMLLATGWPIAVRATQQPTSVAFGKELVALANAGDVAGIVEASRPVRLTCPTVENLPDNVCEGEASGTEVDGYWFGVFGGAEFYSADGYLERVGGALTAFGGGELKLYTIAQGVLLSGHQCAGCFTAVLSTQAEADLSDGQARLFAFQAEPGDAGPVITGVLSGTLAGNEAAVYLRGGKIGLFDFVPVDGPAPPAVGTGLAERRGFDERVAAIGLLVLAATLWAASRRRVA